MRYEHYLDISITYLTQAISSIFLISGVSPFIPIKCIRIAHTLTHILSHESNIQMQNFHFTLNMFTVIHYLMNYMTSKTLLKCMDILWGNIQNVFNFQMSFSVITLRIDFEAYNQIMFLKASDTKWPCLKPSPKQY